MADHAVVLCVDIRGFTVWANQVAAIEAMEDLIHGFYDTLAAAFPSAWRKGLGDGALLVLVQERPASSGVVFDLCRHLVAVIARVDLAFAAQCERVTERYGLPTALRLGWGVTRGTVYPMRRLEDYLGMPLNLATRLCDAARPGGVVIDASAFPLAPHPTQFSAHLLPLAHVEYPLPTWATKEILVQ
jgi:class 3 adenylate cyclase